MYKHYLEFRGDPNSVAECARYAGLKIEPRPVAKVLKPKGVLIAPWRKSNTERAATFGVLCTHFRSKNRRCTTKS